MVVDALEDALRIQLGALGLEPPDTIVLERPRQAEHGDWSTNVALVLAKPAGRNPRQLATDLAARLEADPPRHVAAVEVAGPGFVNFRLRDTWLHDILLDVVTQGVEGYARHSVGAGRTVNVEFVSANPTGPLHAGHARWAAYGDSLARLLERCGHAVHREFYVNDRGNQMAIYGASLAAAKRGDPPPDDGYRGAYITDWAVEMPDGIDPLEWGLAKALDYQREVLARMHVVFDTWFSERTLERSGAMEATLADLRERGYVFEEDGATWLRSTDFGDDKDRVLVRSNGEPTYLLPDIAYHRDKFARGWQHLIDVWGADHHGYVSRMTAAIAALGHSPDDYEVLLGQLVNLLRGGEEVRLSKRTGDIVEMAEVVDEVGPDAARFTFLLQSIDTRQSFDIDAVKAQSMDNPVFYVQYAHARIASIGRVAAERGVVRAPIDTVDLSLLVHERELAVLRSLSELPTVVLDAMERRAPNKVTTWTRELAGAFHGFHHDCYVMGNDVAPELTQARLWLVEAARIGLAVGLDLLGVSAPDSM